MPLSPDQALAVLVGEDGSVENRVIELPRRHRRRSRWCEAGNYMTATLAGLTLAEARARMRARDRATGRAALDGAARDLVERGLAVWSEDGARRPVLIVRGQGRLIDEAAPADLERVRDLLDDLEGKQEIAAPARQRARGRCDADLHRRGEQAVRAVRLVGDRAAVSRTATGAWSAWSA